MLEWYAVEQAPAFSFGKVIAALFLSDTPWAHPLSCFGVGQGRAFEVNLQFILTYHVLFYQAEVNTQSGFR